MLSVPTAFLILQTLCFHAVFTLNKKSLYKTIEEDIKKLRAQTVSCSNADFKNVRRFRCEDKLDKVLLCVGGTLLERNGGESHVLWTVLGDVYYKQGKIAKGNKCFKEANKLGGKFTGEIAPWHFIGPFQIGKTEIDGDPLEAFGGIDKLFCQRYNKDFKLYSELVPGGEVKWGGVRTNENGDVGVNIDLFAAENELDSKAAYEWQGWFVGDFTLNSEMTILIQCSHVSTIYINGNILAGDLYARRQYW